MKSNILRFSLLSLLAVLFGGMAQAQSYTDEALTVTWSMAQGESSTAVATPAEAIASTSWSVASDLAIDYTATATYFDNVSTQFTRVGTEKLSNDRTKLNNSYVEFKFRPQAGLTVTPTALSFDIVKVGTGDPNIWVECIQGSTTTSVAENVAIRRNNQETPSEHQTFNLTEKSTITASGDETIIRIFIGKLGNTKQVAIANIKIEGKVNGTIEKFTTIYNIASSLYASNTVIEGKTGTVAATLAEAAANAPELQVDALNGKLGKNNADWAQINAGTVLTIPGVPQGAKVTFVLYNNTKLSINGAEYGNGDTYTAQKDINLKMTCPASGYIQSITVEGTAFVTVLDTEGYTNTWFFGKSNGAEEFALQKSAEYTYTVEGRSLIINTASGKLNNASRTDQWAQCNDGTLFKVPVYAGSKLSWGRYGAGSDAGFIIDGKLYNDYYIATEEGTAEITAKGISYLSFIKIEPATLYEATGTISGGSINGSSIILTAAGNGQAYTTKIADNAFTVKVPADTYTFDLSEDAPYVVSTPENLLINADGNIGTVTITAAQPQTVTGQITNAPAEAFTLTFTGASHTKELECAANATSYEVMLEPDTYTISSSVGTLSALSKASFKVLKEAANHNIYFPEEAVPAATQQNITVDNTATVAANVYNTVTDALTAAKAGNINAPVITLTSGQTYREQVVVDMSDVTLKTSGEEKATITFYYGIGYTYYSLGENGYYNKDRANTRNSILMKDPSRWGATVLVTVKGNNFKAENIAFENSFNQYYTAEEIADGVRPNGAQSISYDRTLAEDATGYYAADTKQVTERAAAIAFENNPKGVQLYNCVFIGSQDTFYSSGKLYLKNCNIVGNTDYIFGGGLVVFDNCDLTIGGYSDRETSAYITAYKDGSTLDADKKYIFRDCTVKAGTRTYTLANLGRDWGGAAASVYYFNLKNEMGKKLNYTWTNMGGGVSAGTADLHIYDFDPTVNANYSTTGATGANVNGLIDDAKALELYAGAIKALGFTPERAYEDVVELGEDSPYNVCRIAASGEAARNVKLTKALKADQWTTIALPFALAEDEIAAVFGADTKIAELSTADDATLNFVSTAAMSGDKPYIINVAADLVSVDIKGVTMKATAPTQTIGNWTVTGILTTETVSSGSIVMSEGNLKKVADDNTSAKAFSAYFTNSTAADNVTYTIDGTPTAISEMDDVVRQDNKVVYNLAGQRVNKATRGLYIVNGNKVAVK
jgi:pectin methylesterase-like acyl-CoA thioesterase